MSIFYADISYRIILNQNFPPNSKIEVWEKIQSNLKLFDTFIQIKDMWVCLYSLFFLENLNTATIREN